MQNLLVSILIPFKNTQEFIGDCIQSIINQTYTNWELIIIDDNSTDSSFTIVKEFAKKDSRIKLFKNSGSGIIEALQLAFSQSEGDLITRMDSDDIMRSNKLEVMAASLMHHGKGNLAVGLVHYFAEEGIKAGYKSYEVWLNALTAKGTNYSEIYKECVIPSPCWMLHRDDFIACNAFNPNRYPEDYDLAFRFYKHGLTCIPCNTVLHDWRDYSHRTSRTDEHYAENHFIPLKLDYFLELDYKPEKTLFVWGAGNKGKFIAKTLIEKQIDFEWICDNPKKIGKDIYGKILRPFKDLESVINPQSIITVANKEAQQDIRNYLNTLKLKSVEDYVFFC
ncbi:glycosyltransferase [Algibacter amylolyticus]|uniref:Glycosyltransferase n=1 Tax=Algibacter amylolyticus TaxID=1608400 RepID=A0A5M7AZ07_9FLAO|nr:glycosyltransferase [Algibacter amylolyticus]KAA5822409.1 glycosyltransferase [Algibacter amylolyticus]MBB5269128.1 glycosyltransferase involved in cell wall biosynthesis [Algibacter amylolyticus]TSJ73559.1 glycosyltransferase [Algibacter amylolyticus]